MTNDTQIIKNSVVLDNWQTTASGLRYHPIPFTDPLTKTTANLSANFGMSYNGRAQFTFVNSNNNSAINSNFDFSLFTNVDYVEPSTPRFNYGTGTQAIAPVHTIRSALTATDGLIVGGYFASLINRTVFSLGKFSYLGEVANNWPVNTVSVDSGGGFAAQVQKIARDLDGNIVIGGYFDRLHSSFGTVPQIVIKLNPNDGSRVTSFSNTQVEFSTSPQHTDFDIDSDNKIVYVGPIRKYGSDWLSPNSGADRGGIVRINSDGSFDSTFLKGYFDFGGASRNYPSSVLIQDDGKIVVGLVNTNGESAVYRLNDDTIINTKNLIRFNQDGTVDNTFNIAPINGETYTNNARIDGTAPEVRKIIKGLNGDLIIGGYFSSVGGYQCLSLTKLDSTGNANFTSSGDNDFRPRVIDYNIDVTVNDLLLQDDGKIIVVGKFSRWKVNSNSLSVTVNNIVRLNYDGTIDETFVTSVSGFIGAGATQSYGQIDSITKLPDNKFLITGEFTRYHNKTAPGMAILNSDGTYDGATPDKFVGNTTPLQAPWNDNIYRKLNIGGYGENFDFKVENVNNQISLVSRTYPTNFAILDYSIISTYGGVKAGDGTIANSGSSGNS